MAKACFHFMRVILVIISLIFMLLGLAVVALAVFLKVAPPLAQFSSSNAASYINILLYVLIGLGAFMAIFGFIGCFGGCRKSTACLGIYITIILIIIIGEIAIGIFLVIKKKFVEEQINAQMDSAVNEYKKSKNSPLLELIQKILRCCGSNSLQDFEGMDLPATCCHKNFVGTRCNKATAIATGVEGCKTTVKKMWAVQGFPVLIGTILAIAGVEFIGIAFAIAICCHSRRQDAGYVSVVT